MVSRLLFSPRNAWWQRNPAHPRHPALSEVHQQFPVNSIFNHDRGILDDFSENMA
jgi:hypothetical protein